MREGSLVLMDGSVYEVRRKTKGCQGCFGKGRPGVCFLMSYCHEAGGVIFHRLSAEEVDQAKEQGREIVENELSVLRRENRKAWDELRQKRSS